MARAITSSKMFFLTKTTNLSFVMMCSIMNRVVSKLKIFNSVIGFNFVNMVDNFVRSKISTKMFFHNKSVLSNITVGIYKMMVSTSYHNVATVCRNFSSFPIRVFRTIKLTLQVTSSTFLSLKSSFFISRTRKKNFFIAGNTVIFYHNFIII